VYETEKVETAAKAVAATFSSRGPVSAHEKEKVLSSERGGGTEKGNREDVWGDH